MPTRRLLREVKKLDDKLLLVEIHMLECRTHYAARETSIRSGRGSADAAVSCITHRLFVFGGNLRMWTKWGHQRASFVGCRKSAEGVPCNFALRLTLRFQCG